MHPILTMIRSNQIRSSRSFRPERNNHMAAATRTATFPRFPLLQLALGVSIIFLIPGLHTVPEQAQARRALRLHSDPPWSPSWTRTAACACAVWATRRRLGFRVQPCLCDRHWKMVLPFPFPFSLLLAQLANAMCDPRDDAGVLYDDEAVVVVVRAHLNVVLASRRPHADMDIVVAQFEARDQLVIGVRRNSPKTCALGVCLLLASASKQSRYKHICAAAG